MGSTAVMIDLFGAVALLLFGLGQVKSGVTRAFGAKLRKGLAAGTKGTGRSFVSGVLATIALQSSTATALMVSSFVERDLIAAAAAQVVLLGANVGTAITAWIVSTGIQWLAPLLILAGVVLYRARPTAQGKGGGSALVGVGLMLLALHLLGVATEPMRESEALGAFIQLLNNAWPVALIFSAVIALISSSSLATVVLILSLAATGALSPALSIVLVLGANLGGAVPPVIATLRATAAARRVTIGNLITRAIGCLVVLPLAGVAADLAAQAGFSAAKLPVDAHLAFNILLAICALPFAGHLSRLMKRLVPDTAPADDAPRYLDEEALATPVMAITSATRETLYVGDLIERMLVHCAEAFESGDARNLDKISQLEDRVDNLQQDVKLYLSKLGKNDLDEDTDRRALAITDYAINLEHAGDIIERGLKISIAKKISQGLRFSPAGFTELSRMFALTIENVRVAQTIFATDDYNLARKILEAKVEIRRMEKQSAERHLERLRERQVQSLETSSLHLDLLRDLKRINAHFASVAHPILDRRGQLTESRVRTSAE